MSASEPRPPEPSADEVARLKREVARLTEQLERHRAPEARRGWLRLLVAGLLIAVAALLAPLSVVATWANGQIQDTDRYLATVAPLANDPDVQQAVATRIEQVVFTYVDVDAAAAELVRALGESGLREEAVSTLSALTGPLANGVRSFVRRQIDTVVASDAFEQAWVAANRTAHSVVVAALTGDRGGIVQVERGEVTLDLAELIAAVKVRLADAGFGLAERIPEVSATFVLFRSDDLAQVQRLLGLLDTVALWLPVLGLALVATAVYVARVRSRALLAAGLAVAAAMLLLGATLNAIRPIYLDALPASSSPAAAGVIYDQLVSFVRFALRGVLVMALVVAVVAWFSAPRGTGASARRALVRGLSAARRTRSGAGLRTGRLGEVLGRYRGPVRILVVGVAAVSYLAQDHPTGGTALIFVLVTGAVLLVIELLATDVPAAELDSDSDSDVPAPDSA